MTATATAKTIAKIVIAIPTTRNHHNPGSSPRVPSDSRRRSRTLDVDVAVPLEDPPDDRDSPKSAADLDLPLTTFEAADDVGFKMERDVTGVPNAFGESKFGVAPMVPSCSFGSLMGANPV
jgi:hypothetical protein